MHLEIDTDCVFPKDPPPLTLKPNFPFLRWDFQWGRPGVGGGEGGGGD